MPLLSESEHERDQFQHRCLVGKERAPVSDAEPGKPAEFAMVKDVYSGLYPKPEPIERRKSA